MNPREPIELIIVDVDGDYDEHTIVTHQLELELNNPLKINQICR